MDIILCILIVFMNFLSCACAYVCMACKQEIWEEIYKRNGWNKEKR